MKIFICLLIAVFLSSCGIDKLTVERNTTPKKGDLTVKAVPASTKTDTSKTEEVSKTSDQVALEKEIKVAEEDLKKLDETAIQEQKSDVSNAKSNELIQQIPQNSIDNYSHNSDFGNTYITNDNDVTVNNYGGISMGLVEKQNNEEIEGKITANGEVVFDYIEFTKSFDNQHQTFFGYNFNDGLIYLAYFNKTMTKIDIVPLDGEFASATDMRCTNANYWSFKRSEDYDYVTEAGALAFENSSDGQIYTFNNKKYYWATDSYLNEDGCTPARQMRYVIDYVAAKTTVEFPVTNFKIE